MPNTNYQTIHQFGSGVSQMVRQATGRDSVESIEMDWVSVEQTNRYETHEESGELVTFETNVELPMKVTAQINPVQDLNGYEYPWAGGEGENLFVHSDTTYSGNAHVVENQPVAKELTGAYYISFDYKVTTVSGNSQTLIYGYLDGTQVEGNVANFTDSTESSDWIHYSQQFSASITFDAIDIYSNNTMQIKNIMISESEGDFSPYSNICPITGWTECDIYVSPTSDPDDPDKVTYEVEFPDEEGTVYGGILTVNEDGTGTLVVNKAYVKGSSCTWSENQSFQNTYNGIHSARPAIDNDVSGISSIYRMYTSASIGNKDYGFATANNNNRVIYVKDKDISVLSDFITHIADVEFVYTIRSPVTYNLTELEVIETLTGTNNIWSDTGPVSVIYKTKEEII